MPLYVILMTVSVCVKSWMCLVLKLRLDKHHFSYPLTANTLVQHSNTSLNPLDRFTSRPDEQIGRDERRRLQRQKTSGWMETEKMERMRRGNVKEEERCQGEERKSVGQSNWTMRLRGGEGERGKMTELCKWRGAFSMLSANKRPCMLTTSQCVCLSVAVCLSVPLLILNNITHNVCTCYSEICPKQVAIVHKMMQSRLFVCAMQVDSFKSVRAVFKHFSNIYTRLHTQ